MDDAVDVARRIADSLERARIVYAIGGAIAYGYWGAIRATADIDVNVFVAPAEIDRVFAALREAGCSVDESPARARAEERGDFVAKAGNGMRVDVFVPSIPFHEEARRRIVRVPNLDGRPAFVLSAEVVCVFKMLFFRGKDVVDLEHLVARQGPGLDVAFVRAQLVDMVGEEDGRTRRWDLIVRTYRRDTPPEPRR